MSLSWCVATVARSRTRPRSARDERRRSHGQNLLVDRRVVSEFLRRLTFAPDELVVELGPGRGALTLPLARAGALVLAVERDHLMADDLAAALRRAGLLDRVRVLRLDGRRLRLPAEPYRVVANLPFGATTDLLAHLLDDPVRGPWRADVLVQREVAVKRAAVPPTSLRSAAWAPWWRVALGPTVPRTAFRPVPAVEPLGSRSSAATRRCSPPGSPRECARRSARRGSGHPRPASARRRDRRPRPPRPPDG